MLADPRRALVSLSSELASPFSLFRVRLPLSRCYHASIAGTSYVRQSQGKFQTSEFLARSEQVPAAMWCSGPKQVRMLVTSMFPMRGGHSIFVFTCSRRLPRPCRWRGCRLSESGLQTPGASSPACKGWKVGHESDPVAPKLKVENQATELTKFPSIPVSAK